MAGPSLTPNEDAVRAMGMPPSMREAMAKAGFEGVHARMGALLQEAACLAEARELDRATPKADILRAVAIIAGEIVAAAAMGMGTRGHQQQLAGVLHQQLTLAMLGALAMPDFAARSSVAEIVEVASA